MIYFKSDNFRVIQKTKSKKFAEIYKLNETCESENNFETAYNGCVYIKGHAPEKPQSVKNKERVAELKGFLASADYWGQKYIDGEYTEEEWEEKKAQRKAWREEIRSLENSTDSDG